MSLGSAQRLARGWGPALRLLVAFGVAVERAFEVSERDHETGPAVAIAALEDVMLDERPGAVRKGACHGDVPVRQLGRSERGVAVHLADQLVEVSERKLPDRRAQLAWRPRGQKLVALMHGLVAVAHASFAEELRLAKIWVPARATDPAAHHVVAPRHEIGIVRRRRSEQRENLVARLGRGAFIGIEAEDPVMAAVGERLIAQIAEA